MADSRHLPSKRFATTCKDVAAMAPLDLTIKARWVSAERTAKFAQDIDGRKILIRRFPAERAWRGSNTFAMKGGMMGGNGGSCAGVTSGNGIGIVPRAFTDRAR